MCAAAGMRGSRVGLSAVLRFVPGERRKRGTSRRGNMAAGDCATSKPSNFRGSRGRSVASCRVMSSNGDACTATTASSSRRCSSRPTGEEGCSLHILSLGRRTEAGKGGMGSTRGKRRHKEAAYRPGVILTVAASTSKVVQLGTAPQVGCPHP